MKPEKQRLVHDLLGHDECREATMAAGLNVLRRRRRWRTASQALASLLVLVTAGVWLERNETSKSSVPTVAHATPQAVASQAEALTDDQLLALFPHTPVALATLSDGKKRLIFLHPGDEQKYVTKL